MARRWFSLLASLSVLAAQSHSWAADGPPPAAGAVIAPLTTATVVATDGAPVVRFEDSPGGTAFRLWGDLEALYWWVRPVRVPPLLTASPPGTDLASAGIIGTPGATVVFGGKDYNGDGRGGGRLTVGGWVDCDATVGIEADFFLLEGKSAGAAAGSPGIVGRPFIDSRDGLPNSEIVSFPGLLDGHALATASSGVILGGGLRARCNLCCGCDYRVDALVGYRALAFSDGVDVRENLVATDPTQTTALLGTNFQISDHFAARNQFHGADLGLAGQYTSGRWSLEAMGRVALGGTCESVSINGNTYVAVPGFAPVSQSGGLLALSSNIGNHQRTMFGVVPEITARLSYQASPCVRVFAGYTFLCWSQVARAGEQIDPVVNPDLLPPPLPGATPLRPAFRFVGKELWVQGVDLGLQFRF